MKNRLTPKQRIFVAEYIATLNGAEAARKAGVSEASASVRASSWLANRKVKEAIEARLRAIERTAEIKAERIIQELARIGTADMRQFVRRDTNGELELIPIDQLQPDLSAAISEIVIDETGGTGDGERRRVLRTRFKLWPKVPALELLGKIKAMLVTRQERYSEEHLVLHAAEELQRALARVRARPAVDATTTQPAQPAVDAKAIRALPEAPGRSAKEIRADLAEATKGQGEPLKGQEGKE